MSTTPMHTPGPWFIRDMHPERCTLNIGTRSDDPYDGEVAVIYRALSPHSEADARLIAAAPELLEALKQSRHELSCLNLEADGAQKLNSPATRVLDQINAAIAKAEGRS